jgi:hypothetical protein
MNYHPLTKKILPDGRLIEVPPNSCWLEGVDKIIREWLKEKADDLKCIPDHNFTKVYKDKVDSYLEINEPQSLEEKFEEYIFDKKCKHTHCKELAQIAHDHYKESNG